MNQLRKANVPAPTGWRILIEPREAPEKIGNILLADQVKDVHKLAILVARVLEVGPDAYTGERFLDSEPWCKEGDWVLVPKFSGVKFKVYEGTIGKEYRIINDDEVLAIVPAPDVIRHE